MTEYNIISNTINQTVKNSAVLSQLVKEDSSRINAAGYPAYSTLPNSLTTTHNTTTYIYPVTIPGIEGQPGRYVPRTIAGEKLQVSCGTVAGFTRCRDCGAAQSKIVHCGNIHCPTCSGYRIRREVRAVVQRLHGYKRATDNQTNPRHVVISLDSWYNDSTRENVRTDLTPEKVIKSFTNQLSRRLKFLNGYYVLHWFRVNDLVKDAFKNTKKENKFPGGLWENIKRDFLGLGCFEKYVKVAPHIHFVGYGRFPKADKFHAETGIFYKTKSQRSFDFERCESGFGFTSQIIRTLSYLGSHAAIPHIDGVWGDTTKRRAVIFRACGRVSVKNLRETDELDYVVTRDISCFRCDSYNIETGAYKLKIDSGYADNFPDDVSPVEIDLKDSEPFKWSWKRFVFAGEEEKPRVEHQSNFKEIEEGIPTPPAQFRSRPGRAAARGVSVTERVIGILSHGSRTTADKIRDSLQLKTSQSKERSPPGECVT